MRLRSPPRLVAYVAVVTAAAVVMLALAPFDTPVRDSQFWNTLFALAGLALLAEVFSLQLRVASATSAVSFIPYLATVLLLGPSWAMAIAGSTELIAESVVRRKPLIKILHNTSKEIVSLGAAGLFYRYAGGVPSNSDLDFYVNVAAFIGAALIYFIIGNGSTATAVAFSTGADLGETWNEIVGKDLVQNILSCSLAPLLAFLWVKLDILGLGLVVAPLFFVRHALRANIQMEQANRELLELMVKSIEARDPYTSGHSVRVATYARLLARALGLAPREVGEIETAALLHDVGKIYEEFGPILRKEGRLTDAERHLMHTHPARSASLVSTISSLRGYVERCVRSHHENFDGSGYPDGLVGTQIPLGARIIMVADTADAMMTDRPYRKALSYEAVVREFTENSGGQFDPTVIEAFRRSAAIRRVVEERHGESTRVNGLVIDGIEVRPRAAVSVT